MPTIWSGAMSRLTFLTATVVPKRLMSPASRSIASPLCHTALKYLTLTAHAPHEPHGQCTAVSPVKSLR
jgi:hypothetical protein